MLFIRSDQTDPYFNIAAEEFFLKSFDEDIFFLYINKPSIIVGKHQNALAEINYNFVKDNNIPVVRRLSGGGTVYHDEGNVNYTFIINGKEGKLVNFKKYIDPIVNALRIVGLHPEIGKRNEILIDGLKISGNAEHIFKKRILHHGTLLYEADIDKLNRAISVNPLIFKSKAIKSVRSRVTNISEHLNEMGDVKVFSSKIFDLVQKQFDNAAVYKLSKDDNKKIYQLIDDKYNSWKWNFAYSPAFTFQRAFMLGKSRCTVKVFVKSGNIENIDIVSSFLNEKEILQIKACLIGNLYNIEVLNQIKAKYKDGFERFDFQTFLNEIHL